MPTRLLLEYRSDAAKSLFVRLSLSGAGLAMGMRRRKIPWPHSLEPRAHSCPVSLLRNLHARCRRPD